jgi:radical SAM superfamily enzyme YgiQ (UPF0313 family)
MPPTSPPCGIAYLKAFLGSGKTFDLNLAYHDILVDMAPDMPGTKVEPEKLKEAVTFLKGGNTFYDPDQYNNHISVFFDFFNSIYPFIQKESIQYINNSATDTITTLFEKMLSPVRKYHPDIIGFSQLVLPQKEPILALAHAVKNDDIPVVLGGASLWYNPEAYLSGNHIDLSDIFDVIVYGEGEIPLKMLINGEPLEKIPNIVYNPHTIIKNERNCIHNLDDIPCPDFSDFPLTEYYSPEIVLPILTSRGCYWGRCTFCTHHKSYNQYRTSSVNHVITTIKTLQTTYNASYFLIADEMVHPHRFDQLATTIQKEGLKIRMYSEAKPTNQFTLPLLQKMFAAGVRVLLWGVESGTQRILDLMDKGTTVPDIESVLTHSDTAGIWNMVFMIVHYPTQTVKEIEDDITFLQKNAQVIHTLTSSPFKLQVGSKMYENPEKFGITHIEPAGQFSPVCEYTTESELSLPGSSSTPDNPQYPDISLKDYLSKKYSVECIVLSDVSWYFGKMRDHLLLYADKLSENPL